MQVRVPVLHCVLGYCPALCPAVPVLHCVVAGSHASALLRVQHVQLTPLPTLVGSMQSWGVWQRSRMYTPRVTLIQASCLLFYLAL